MWTLPPYWWTLDDWGVLCGDTVRGCDYEISLMCACLIDLMFTNLFVYTRLVSLLCLHDSLISRIQASLCIHVSLMSLWCMHVGLDTSLRSMTHWSNAYRPLCVYMSLWCLINNYSLCLIAVSFMSFMSTMPRIITPIEVSPCLVELTFMYTWLLDVTLMYARLIDRYRFFWLTLSTVSGRMSCCGRGGHCGGTVFVVVALRRSC